MPIREVYRIFVLPERSGAGIGQALMESAVEQLRAAASTRRLLGARKPPHSGFF